MNTNMRLAIVVNKFPTISETFIFNKVLGLLEAGVDVTVWVHDLNSDSSSFVDRLEHIHPERIQSTLLVNGIARVPMKLMRMVLSNPTRSVRLLKQALALYPDIRRALRAWVMALPFVLGGFDLIHFEYSGLTVTYLDVLPLLHPAKLLTSCRGAAEQITPLIRPERAGLLKEMFAQMDAIHCVSGDIQRTCIDLGLQLEKSFINHPSIDPQKFQRRKPYPLKVNGPYRLISVGRLHWKKGLEFALLAIKQVVDAGQDVQYHIVGGGEEEEKLRFLIYKLGLRKQVTLLGKQPAQVVYAELEETDIFLLPSLSEGLSNAVLEAMAMEIPVIVTAVGGMSETITDGEEGFLVTPMEPDEMAAKINTLLASIELRTKMGQAGRERIKHQFHLNRQINCFVEQYNKLVDSNVIS